MEQDDQMLCEINSEFYKIEIKSLKNKKLLISFQKLHSIVPIEYKLEMDHKELISLVPYFKDFIQIDDIYDFIMKQINEKSYSVSLNDDSSEFKLTLIPKNLDEPIIILIPLFEQDKDSIISNLYSIIVKMSSEINKLNTKINILEKNQVTQNQIEDSNNKIEKLTIKLNKINSMSLNVHNDNQFFNRIKTVMSNNVIINWNEENELFRYWINPNGNIKLSLIYKATIDSDFASAFHSKCDDHAPTIIIIKTDKGIRFGGYTTQTWNCDEECKKDENAFLFNLDTKRKYDIKKNAPFAIYCKENFGPAFGEGFDLFLCDNYMGLHGSYSNFPCSYGECANSSELTLKQFDFNISDVECYQVDFE